MHKNKEQTIIYYLRAICKILPLPFLPQGHHRCNQKRCRIQFTFWLFAIKVKFYYDFLLLCELLAQPNQLATPTSPSACKA